MATDFNKLKVVDLKAELKRRGLPQNGLKSELVARLEADEAPEDPSQLEAPGAHDTEPDAEDERGDEPEDGIAEVGMQQDAPATEETAISDLPNVPDPQSDAPPSDLPLTNAEAPLMAEKIAEPDTKQEHSQSTLPNSPSAQNQEIMQDTQKRKRRSQSPPPLAEEVARKRLRQSEEVDETGATDASLKNVVNTQSSPQGLPEPTIIESRDEDMLDGTIQSGPTREPYMSPSRDNIPSDIAEIQEIERDVEPAIHPATSALYIKNFMRPLRPHTVQDHLVGLATTPGAVLDDSVLVNFYLDTIKTHAFAVFNSVSAASRVRNALHNCIWPDETNRKALWVDFMPFESFQEWVDREQSQAGGRGSARRYEVVYEDDGDGNVIAHHQETGVAPISKAPPPPPQPDRKASFQSGLAREGVEGAPLGPRNFQQRGTLAANSGRSSRVEDSPGAFTTRTQPPVVVKPVADELANRRLTTLTTAKSRDLDRALGKDYKRYYFENGDFLVDRGPEIFLGIRPPHRERERRWQQGRERSPGGGGRHRGPMPLGNRRNRPPRAHHSGVPRGGDRYRP